MRGDAVTIARMAVAALRWFKAALLLQIVLLAYWLAIELVDLHPWNDIGARPANYDLNRSLAANALQQLAYMGVFALGLRLLSFAPALGYAVYLALQIWTWWVPYAAGASAAWAEDEGLRGTLQHQGQPVNGVKISVASEDGKPVGDATTGADGAWEVPLPGPGTYKVTIDQTTLPPDVELRFKERATLTLSVAEDQRRTALFALVPKGQAGEGGQAAASELKQPSAPQTLYTDSQAPGARPLTGPRWTPRTWAEGSTSPTAVSVPSPQSIRSATPSRAWMTSLPRPPPSTSPPAPPVTVSSPLPP